MTAQLTRKYGLAVKAESTYATDSVPTEANIINIWDLEIKIDQNKVELPYLRSTLSNSRAIIGYKQVNLTFNIAVKGSGTAGTAPESGQLFKIAKMSETVVAATRVTYSFDSTSQASATVYLSLDQGLLKIVGCRGNWEITGKGGDIAVCKFTVEGIYSAFVDSSLGVGTNLNTTLPPICKATSFTLDSYAASCSEIQFTSGNKLVRIPNINATEGIGDILISEREPKCKLNVERVLEATNPYMADFIAGNQIDSSMVIGTAAGNICTITSRLAYDSLQFGVLEGTARWDIEARMFDETSQGDTEFSMVFT